MRRAWLVGALACVAAGLLLVRACAGGGQGTTNPPPRQGSVAGLTVPDGFRVNVFVSNLRNPRVILPGPNGAVYVSQPAANQVALLRDTDGDGAVDQRLPAITGVPQAHGLAIRENTLYIASPTQLWVADLQPDGTATNRRALADLPAGGQHGRRTLGFGPDGLLYVSVGSTTNNTTSANPEHAAILVMRPDGTERRVFARGLRNTSAFDWHPATGELWGADNGTDRLGDDTPPEELNHLLDGRHYGWPWCYGDRQVDPTAQGTPPGGLTPEEFCATTEPMVLGYQAHSAPMQLRFYTGEQFPAAYRNDAFLTFRGSWNRSVPTGYKVVRILFDDAGRPTGFEDFLTGFLTGRTVTGRPYGLAQLPDGSLLVGDDTGDTIYRVRYGG